MTYALGVPDKRLLGGGLVEIDSDKLLQHENKQQQQEITSGMV